MALSLFFEARKWWVFVLRGLVAIAFGILTWIFPSMALLTLVLLFGAYAIVDGVSEIAAALSKSPDESPRWLLVLYGIVSIAAGIIALFYPGITALVLLMLIAARSIFIGVLETVSAIRLRKEIEGEWMLATSGILSIAFGVLLIVFPRPGALGLLLWIGAYAILFGGLLVALGLKLRSVKQRMLGEAVPLRERFAGH